MTTRIGAARAAYAPTLRVATDADEKARAAITRAIEEVLGTVTIPVVRERLLNKALKSAGLTAPPVSRIALRYFVEGSLHEALNDILGDETADVLLEELREMADRFAAANAPSSGVRRLESSRPRDLRSRTATTKIAIPRLRLSLVPK